MSWTTLLAEKRVAAEPPAKQELDDLRAIVSRSVSDARAVGLSADGRFNFSYNAARSLATIVVRAAGYRVKSQGGGHYNTFLALEAADATFSATSAYLDACRVKRNEFSYDGAGVVSDTEADELGTRTNQFAAAVDAWLQANHPAMA